MERETRRKKIASQETDRMALITGRISTPEPDNRSRPDHSHGLHGVANTVKMETRKSITDLQKLEKKEAYKPFEYHLSSVSPKEIHFSIISSENTRVVCSLVIAVLVVLSHVNLPHNVVKSKSLIAYRPLYALLLTDALIVAARLAIFSEVKEDDDDKDIRNNNNSNWEGAIKLLEWGLVLHQTVRAVFIDCSFYVAVVACGLSVV